MPLAEPADETPPSGKTSRCRRALAAAALLLALQPILSSDALAWPKEAYENMVYDTIRMLPPRLARVLLARDEAIVRGVTALESETASILARDGSRGAVSTELVADVESRIERIAALVGAHRPLDEMAFELGKLLRIAADVSDPAVLGSGRREFRRVLAEYYRFIGLNLHKLPLVHDERVPSPLDGATLASLLASVASETTASVSPLSNAFWRGGRVVPAQSFDFRSVPYAETSLSYSRGVTAASYLWLAAWSRANGDFTGYRFAPKSH